MKAIGTYVCQSEWSNDDVCRLKELVRLAAEPWSFSQAAWGTEVSRTWAFIKRYEELREWDLTHTTKAEQVIEQREAEYHQRVADYDRSQGMEWEAATWDHDLLFHLATNPLVRDILPPMPWTHDAFEAADVIYRLKSCRFEAMTPPPEARLLKCKFIVSGLDQRYVQLSLVLRYAQYQDGIIVLEFEYDLLILVHVLTGAGTCAIH